MLCNSFLKQNIYLIAQLHMKKSFASWEAPLPLLPSQVVLQSAQTRMSTSSQKRRLQIKSYVLQHKLCTTLLFTVYTFIYISINIYISISISISMYLYVYIYIYIQIYVERERERERCPDGVTSLYGVLNYRC